MYNYLQHIRDPRTLYIYFCNSYAVRICNGAPSSRLWQCHELLTWFITATEALNNITDGRTNQLLGIAELCSITFPPLVTSNCKAGTGIARTQEMGLEACVFDYNISLFPFARFVCSLSSHSFPLCFCFSSFQCYQRNSLPRNQPWRWPSSWNKTALFGGKLLW